MFYIYILYSQIADKFYIGQTPDVQKRLREHNNPLVNSKFTAKFIPWELVLYFPVTSERGDAMKVEKFIKRQKSRQFILQLIENKEDPEFIKKLIKDVIPTG
jgi:putative endonuclease